MGKFTAMLQYQAADARLRKLEVEIENHSDYVRAVKARELFEDAKRRAENTEQKADELLKHYEKMLAVYADGQKKLEDIEVTAAAGIAADNVDKIRTAVSKIGDLLSRLEKEIGQLSSHLENILRVNDTARKDGSKFRTIFDDSAAKYKKFKSTKTPEIDALNKELAALAAGVDKRLLDHYNALRKDKVLPAFVTLEKTEKSWSCSGCRMDLPMDTLSKLKADGMIECDNCRRIIYME